MGADGWVRKEGVAWMVSAPLGGAVCRGHAQDTPFFLPATEAAGFCPLCIVCVCLPQLCKSQLLLAPSSFFTSCCPRRHWSKRKLSRRGTKGSWSQVPASLSDMNTEVFAMIQNRLWAGPRPPMVEDDCQGTQSCDWSVRTFSPNLRPPEGGVQSPVTSDVMLQNESSMKPKGTRFKEPLSW